VVSAVSTCQPSPGTGKVIRFEVADRQVIGEGLVHFLVPARAFWDDIGFT
jgi:hypothetical protein